MVKTPKNFVFVSFGKIFAQFRKNLLSFQKKLLSFQKFSSVFRKKCPKFAQNYEFLDKNRQKCMKIITYWRKNKKYPFLKLKLPFSEQIVEYLKISYIWVLPIFLSFSKNWASVSGQIASKKSLDVMFKLFVNDKWYGQLSMKGIGGPSCNFTQYFLNALSRVVA